MWTQIKKTDRFYYIVVLCRMQTVLTLVCASITDSCLRSVIVATFNGHKRHIIALLIIFFCSIAERNGVSGDWVGWWVAHSSLRGRINRARRRMWKCVCAIYWSSCHEFRCYIFINLYEHVCVRSKLHMGYVFVYVIVWTIYLCVAAKVQWDCVAGGMAWSTSREKQTMNPKVFFVYTFANHHTNPLLPFQSDTAQLSYGWHLVQQTFIGPMKWFCHSHTTNSIYRVVCRRLFCCPPPRWLIHKPSHRQSVAYVTKRYYQSPSYPFIIISQCTV